MCSFNWCKFLQLFAFMWSLAAVAASPALEPLSPADQDALRSIEVSYLQWSIARHKLKYPEKENMLARHALEKAQATSAHWKHMEKIERRRLMSLTQELSSTRTPVLKLAVQNVHAALASRNLTKETKFPCAEVTNYLSREYEKPLTLSPLAWQTIQDLFSRDCHDEFLLKSFAAQKMESRSLAGIVSEEGDDRIEILAVAGEPWIEELRGSGFQVVVLPTSNFTEIEYRAQELNNFIESRIINSPEKMFILVSSADSSGLIYKYLDFYPHQRRNPHIQAWLNLNGRPFDMNPAELAYAPLPLGKGFPIYNLIDTGRRPASTWRDSIVGDGEVHTYSNRAPVSVLREWLIKLSRP